MSDHSNATDFNGSPLQVGDVVVYITRERALANGIIIDLMSNYGVVYTLLNIDSPSRNLDTASWSTIMYNGSDYRGMTGDYILSLHGIELD